MKLFDKQIEKWAKRTNNKLGIIKLLQKDNC